MLEANPHPQSELRAQMARPIAAAEKASVALLDAADLPASSIANNNRVHIGITNQRRSLDNEVDGENVVAEENNNSGPTALTVGPQPESPFGDAYLHALLRTGQVIFTLLENPDVSVL